MKILIAYASRTGTAEKCALALAEKLSGAEICNLRKDIVDPNLYDAVIVGGGIRGGVLIPEAAMYLEKCEDILLGKKLGLFICCGALSSAQEQDYIERNVSEKLRAHASACMSFGGELAPERARGIDKFMLKMMARSAAKDGGAPRLFAERIADFAEKFSCGG